MANIKIKGKNIFITGGSGFIGSAIASRLIEHNRIWCYDNLRRFSARMKELLRHRNMTFIKGDILDKKKLGRSIPKNIDIIMHLAAIAGVSSYYQMPLETMKVNVLGTYNILEAVKDRSPELFIDFSTSEVYGRRAENVSEDDDTRQGPISDLRWTYSISKIAAEEFTHCYHHKYGLPVVSIRPFNIYGPGQVGEGAIQIFIAKALKNETIYVNGDGSQVRAWCHIDDLVEGALRCIAFRKKSAGESFNIGNPSGKATSLGLARLIVKLSGSKSKIKLRRIAHSDIDYRVPDISKAKALIGYRPKVGLKEGLAGTIEWHRRTAV